MAKLKVAFFAEILVADYDGAARTMYQLIKRIDKTKFDFLFLCGDGPEQIYNFGIIKVPAFTLPINKNYKISIPQIARKRLIKSLDEFQPDIIHIATPSLIGKFALQYGKKNNKPIVSIYHTHFISYIDYYLRKLPFLIAPVKKSMRKGLTTFYNNCNMLYVPAESMLAELKQMGVQSNRMKIWKRGIDTDNFSAQKKDTDWMQQLTGNTKPVVLFASRLVWEKNLETLFRIYNALQQKNIAHNFIIAGDGIAMEASKKKHAKSYFFGQCYPRNTSKTICFIRCFCFPFHIGGLW